MDEYNKIQNYLLSTGVDVKDGKHNSMEVTISIHTFEQAYWYKEKLNSLGFTIEREDVPFEPDPDEDFESFMKKSLMRSSGKHDDGYKFHMIINQNNKEVYKSKPITESDVYELNRLLYNILRSNTCT